MSERIVLKTKQLEHYQRIVTIASNHSVILDKSRTGRGKSVIASQFILDSRCKYNCVVCPKSVENDWRNRIAKYGLPIQYIISYQSFRGTKDSHPKHGLIYRDEEGEFHVSQLLCQMVEEGFNLILDEVQSIKNDCDQTAAIQPLPRYRSFVYSLSSSPYDIEENCINYFITMGIIKNPKLFDKFSNRPAGASDLFQYASRFNLQRTNQILGHNDVSSKTITNVCYKICTEVLLPIMSSFIEDGEEENFKQSIYYAYFNIPDEGHELIKAGIKMIHKSLRRNPNEVVIKNEPLEDLFNSLEIGHNMDDMRGITHGMITVQCSKAKYIIIPFVKRCFATVPNVKVVIFFDNKRPLQIAMEGLAEFNPTEITGKCSREERALIIAKFQEANLDSRLLIFISQFGEAGIQLDDKHGNFPRISVGCPGFGMIRMLQIPGRTCRQDSKSNSLFFWVYAKSDEYCEQSIINSIKKKSKVLSETLDNDTLTPIMYVRKEEPEIYDFMTLLENAGGEKAPPKEVIVPKKITFIGPSMKSIF